MQLVKAKANIQNQAWVTQVKVLVPLPVKLQLKKEKHVLI